MLLQGALLATQVAAQRSDYGSLTVGAASLGAQLLTMRNGREAELESDLYGMRYMKAAGYDPSAAVTLQETFVRLSEQSGGGGGRLATLFASHPPSAERVAEKSRDCSDAGSGRRSRPRTLSGRNGAVAAAQTRLRRLRRRPRGARRRSSPPTPSAPRKKRCACCPPKRNIHALLGDIDFEQRRYADAVRHYADAIGRDDDFFYYHLQKGLAHRQLRQWEESRAELETSVRLLPTADAVLRARHAGRATRRSASGARALRASGRLCGRIAGKAAQDATVRLDLPANPGKYIQARGGLDNSGQLVVEVANPTRVAVTNVLVAVRYADAQGAIRELDRRINQLPAGQATRFATGLGPFTSAQQFEVGVTDARVARND